MTLLTPLPLLAALSLVVSGFVSVAIFLHLRRPRQSGESPACVRRLPPISVLKPLKGVDEG